jgi:hypothetical protein
VASGCGGAGHALARKSRKEAKSIEWRERRPWPKNVRFEDARHTERVIDRQMPPKPSRAVIGTAAALCEESSLEPPVQRPDHPWKKNGTAAESSSTDARSASSPGLSLGLLSSQRLRNNFRTAPPLPLAPLKKAPLSRGRGISFKET